ncbi:rifampicin resistance protein [Diachasmimorpha longicaudata entomopoxvirus]|uniref:62 kDa protein n=1 Tax=Diachasmimorpha longicaudata entomopoxvirus TaxID=109981 RepID=Q9E8Q8_9POXV|nr:RI-1 protein [Diachasmimorpha longicaudata entomopoxvirus]YP_009666167.1 rifampicin resistance protein [Diachasmimorpha longicaudata entomopoxvirus]AAG31325.1 RI-1 protein [Diachasmimorpha longicaudata entomopoxvirus]ABR68540.1 rifampicin resistance protein [Diachasmimorpha longicaudata entomopoxvirus]
MELTTFNTNHPFIHSAYPKTFSYVPKNENDIYSVNVTDVRVEAISSPEIKLILPEIKGKGRVSYLKNYQFLLLDYFEIWLKNKDEHPFLFHKAKSEEIFSTYIINEYHSLNYFTNKDDFLTTKEGTHADCIIFPKKEISIPLDSLLSAFKIFKDTEIIFNFKFHNIEEIIAYDVEFRRHSLEQLKKNFSETSLNIRFQFLNVPIISSAELTATNVITKKDVIGKDNTQMMNTSDFSNTIAVSFHSKSDIFNHENRYIINPGVDYSEDVLVQKWVLNILKDLLIVTTKDMSLSENKKALGFKDEAVFHEITKNTMTFNKLEKRFCKITIENIPEDHKLYYHTNILSFTRRFQHTKALNVSTLFKKITGVYLPNQKVINFLDIDHSIDIKIVSLPISIWDHELNSHPGDLRSNAMKERDFFFKNRFLLGMDFNCKDRGYERISLKGGKDIFENLLRERKPFLRKLPIIEFDPAMQRGISLYTTFISPSLMIYADPSINFTNFLVEIQWKEYDECDPLNLLKRFPCVDLYEMQKITQNPDTQRISIESI